MSQQWPTAEKQINKEICTIVIEDGTVYMEYVEAGKCFLKEFDVDELQALVAKNLLASDAKPTSEFENMLREQLELAKLKLKEGYK